MGFMSTCKRQARTPISCALCWQGPLAPYGARGRRPEWLKRADLREAIEDVAAKVSRYQAVLVRAIVSATYNWAQDRELIEASPAQHKDRRKGQGSHSRLYRGRTAPILACARRRPLRVDGSVTALKLLILTGKRLAEVVIAKKADVHLGGFDPYWFLPDTKNGQPMMCRLTETTRALFAQAMAAAGNKDFIFPAMAGSKRYPWRAFAGA
jgi:integrase